MEGTVVSRKDVFENDELESIAPEGAEMSLGNAFEFEEVRFESPVAEEEAHSDAVDLQFQLFGGSGPVKVSLEEPEEQAPQGRPDSYYFYRPSAASQAQARAAAVDGASVLKEARFWVQRAAKNPIARDVNIGWRPVKRPCRPGKEARTKKRQRHERLEAERKAEAERWQLRRRTIKTRGPPRRPRSGFTLR